MLLLKCLQFFLRPVNPHLCKPQGFFCGETALTVFQYCNTLFLSQLFWVRIWSELPCYQKTPPQIAFTSSNHKLHSFSYFSRQYLCNIAYGSDQSKKKHCCHEMKRNRYHKACICSIQEGRVKIPGELENKSTIIKKVAFGVVTSVEIQSNRTLLLSLLVL